MTYTVPPEDMYDTEYRRRNRVRDALIYWAYCTVPKCTYQMLREVTGLSVAPLIRIVKAQREGTHPWATSPAIDPVHALALAKDAVVEARRNAQAAVQADRERRRLRKWRTRQLRGLRAYALRATGATGREIGQRLGVGPGRGLQLAHWGLDHMRRYYHQDGYYGRQLRKHCGNHQQVRATPSVVTRLLAQQQVHRDAYEVRWQTRRTRELAARDST